MRYLKRRTLNIAIIDVTAHSNSRLGVSRWKMN
jgi:hypothetical protein